MWSFGPFIHCASIESRYLDYLSPHSFGCSSRTGVDLTVVLICIYFLMYDIEHLFATTCHLYIMSGEVAARYLVNFKLGSLFYDCWVLRILCAFWVNSLSDVSFANIVSYSVYYLFIVLIFKHFLFENVFLPQSLTSLSWAPISFVSIFDIVS